MHISRRPLALALAIIGLAPTAALASPDQSISDTKLKADWTSPVGTGFNTSYFLDGTAGQAGTCGALSDPRAACDKTLVHVTGTVGEGSSITFRIDGFLPASDFDIRVYTSNAEGALESDLGSPTSTDAEESSPLGALDPRRTSAGDYENKVVGLSEYADYETGKIDQWFAVVVPYFLVVNDKYAGHATLDAKPFVAPTGG